MNLITYALIATSLAASPLKSLMGPYKEQEKGPALQMYAAKALAYGTRPKDIKIELQKLSGESTGFPFQ